MNEMNDAFVSRPGTQAGLLAVADAQLAKARVTISEEEIRNRCCVGDSITITTLIALLRRHGVEVTP